MTKKRCLIKIEKQIEQLKPGIYHLSLQDNYVVRDTNHEVRSASNKRLPRDIRPYINELKWDNMPAWGIGNKYWEKLLRIVDSLSNEITMNPKNQSKILDLVSKIVIENLEDKSNVIPTTRLRMLYEGIGDDISKTLDDSFCRAIFDLQKYKPSQKNNNNGPVPFHDKKRREPSLHNATQKLQKYFKDSPQPIHIVNEIKGDNKTCYKYLDKELSPLRTPNGLYEDGGGARKSGGGGIDILCKNLGTNNPVIIEYKSENDHSLFYALIQVLTYASELSTDNQKKRLSANYDELKKGWAGQGNSQIELCIMYDAVTNKKKENRKKQEVNYVNNICMDLKKLPGIKKYIASISLVEVTKSNSSYEFLVKSYNKY